MRKVLVMGLPGVGKTTLARALADKLNAVHLNGDEFRKDVFRELGCNSAGRLEQARRLGWIADQIAKSRQFVIADFVCSTEESRRAFQAERQAFVIWVDRIKAERKVVANGEFEPPATYNIRVTAPGTVEQWASRISMAVRRSVGAGIV